MGRIVYLCQPSRRGNKQIKRAFFLSAFAALADPASRTYYDKKINQGKHHTQALLCLARRLYRHLNAAAAKLGGRDIEAS